MSSTHFYLFSSMLVYVNKKLDKCDTKLNYVRANMIVDCMTFFNEIDLLRIRLSELDSIVDKFVIVESGQTFAGASKIFSYETFQEEFIRYANKITYVKLPRLIPLIKDNEANRFKLEIFSRNAILYGLIQLELADDDIVLVSDIDEIPSLDSIVRLKDQCSQNSTKISWTFKQFFQKSFFDDELDDGYSRNWWGGTVAVRYSAFADFSPQDVRRIVGGGGRKYDEGFCESINSGVLENAGWHLSSFGGRSLKEYKLANYAHGVNRTYDASAENIMTKDHLVNKLLDDSSVEFALRQFVNDPKNSNIPRIVREAPLLFKHFFKCSYIQDQT